MTLQVHLLTTQDLEASGLKLIVLHGDGGGSGDDVVVAQGFRHYFQKGINYITNYFVSKVMNYISVTITLREPPLICNELHYKLQLHS